MNDQTDAKESTDPTSKQQFHYFLVSGEIEYIERKYNKSPRYAKANTVYESPINGLGVAQLGKCQVDLQMNFHRHYSRTHEDPPEVTNVTIIAASFIGTFTKEEFLRRPEKKSVADVDAKAVVEELKTLVKEKQEKKAPAAG